MRRRIAIVTSMTPDTMMLAFGRAVAVVAVVASGFPITAFVVRCRSLIAIEKPRPSPVPKATAPTHVTWVIRSPAYRRTSRPVTRAFAPSCTSVSLRWPM